MQKNTQRILTGAALAALPTLFLFGCSGGSTNGGGIISPTAAPEPTTTTTAVPTVTPIPTNTPVGPSDPTFALDATFSSVQSSNVPPTFKSEAGTSFFSNTDVASTWNTSFEYLGVGNSRTLDLGFSKNRKFKAGDAITLTNIVKNGSESRVLGYTDKASGQHYVASGGSVKIESLTVQSVPGSQVATNSLIKFKIRDAVMVPATGFPNNAASGTFKINGTGEVRISNFQ